MFVRLCPPPPAVAQCSVPDREYFHFQADPRAPFHHQYLLLPSPSLTSTSWPALLARVHSHLTQAPKSKTGMCLLRRKKHLRLLHGTQNLPGTSRESRKKPHDKLFNGLLPKGSQELRRGVTSSRLHANSKWFYTHSPRPPLHHPADGACEMYVLVWGRGLCTISSDQNSPR